MLLSPPTIASIALVTAVLARTAASSGLGRALSHCDTLPRDTFHRVDSKELRRCVRESTSAVAAVFCSSRARQCDRLAGEFASHSVAARLSDAWARGRLDYGRLGKGARPGDAALAPLVLLFDVDTDLSVLTDFPVHSLPRGLIVSGAGVTTDSLQMFHAKKVLDMFPTRDDKDVHGGTGEAALSSSSSSSLSLSSSSGSKPESGSTTSSSSSSSSTSSSPSSSSSVGAGAARSSHARAVQSRWASVVLPGGTQMPRVGVDLAEAILRCTGDDCGRRVVSLALEAGIRNIAVDFHGPARVAGGDAGGDISPPPSDGAVRRAIAAGIKDSGLPRSDLFLEARFSIHGGVPAKNFSVALDRVLEELDSGYVDLVFIGSSDANENQESAPSAPECVAAYAEITRAYRDGIARAVGVGGDVMFDAIGDLDEGKELEKLVDLSVVGIGSAHSEESSAAARAMERGAASRRDIRAELSRQGVANGVRRDLTRSDAVLVSPKISSDRVGMNTIALWIESVVAAWSEGPFAPEGERWGRVDAGAEAQPESFRSDVAWGHSEERTEL